MLDLIFEEMAKIGWHLDDFKEVLDCHKTTMENVCDDEKMNDTNIQYVCQFMIDFARAVELLDKDTDIMDAFLEKYLHKRLISKER